MPNREAHVARKSYPCSAPFGPCTRRIERGHAYTQISYKPGELGNSPTWQIQRACSSCIPVEGVAADRVPCGAGADGAQCALTAGHYPATPHEFPIGLFL